MAKKVYIGAEITIVCPSEAVKKWVKANLELDNPDYIKRVRLGLWIGNTPKKLKLYRIGDKGEIYVPYGCLRNLPLNKETCILEFHRKPVVKFNINEDIKLFDYQQNAVDRMYERKFGILQAPAGSGKTTMGLFLIAKWEKRALWITHTNDLVEQTHKRAVALFGRKGIRKLTTKMIREDVYVTSQHFIDIVTIQTLYSNDNYKFIGDKYDTIIVDECHHVSGSPTNMTMYYKVLSGMRARHKYGLSATVLRQDGMIKSTFALLGDIEVAIDKKDASHKLRQVGVKIIRTGTPLTFDCLDSAGRINFTKTLNYLVTNESRNASILSELILHRDRTSILLTDRVEHMNTLIDMLPSEMKPYAVTINGKSKKEVRNEAIEGMRTGKYKYLFASYQLAKEGLDIPRLETAYFLTPHKDESCIIQCIGRVARACDKKDPYVVDFVDNDRFFEKMYRKRKRIYKNENCSEVADG